jgi:hypothetical protein
MIQNKINNGSIKLNNYLIKIMSCLENGQLSTYW